MAEGPRDGDAAQPKGDAGNCAHENGDGRKVGSHPEGQRKAGVGGGWQERLWRVSGREGRSAAAVLGEPPRLCLLFSKYHMTAPMCCRLAQVNSSPRNRPEKKNVSAIL